MISLRDTVLDTYTTQNPETLITQVMEIQLQRFPVHQPGRRGGIIAIISTNL